GGQGDMFEQSIVISGKGRKDQHSWTFALSLIIQVGILAVLVVIPLIYYSVLPATAMSAFLAAPPPPPPPPPPQPKVQVVVHRMVSQFQNNQLLAPPKIPKKILMVKDQAPPPPSTSGVVGGFSTGGAVGGVIGGLANSAAPPPPPPAAPSGPIHIGGDVEAANCISCPYPRYPDLARQARISGAVVLHAIIGKDGRIKDLRLISGHPMLVGAAMQAVRNWRYHPTVLDGQPVEVDTEITINFTLAGG
ncbi:MAG: energy transducer TonB, partial [Terriglobales bacterium]